MVENFQEPLGEYDFNMTLLRLQQRDQAAWSSLVSQLRRVTLPWIAKRLGTLPPYSLLSKQELALEIFADSLSKYFDLFAKSPLEFEKNLEEIVGKFKEEIQEFEPFTILRIHVFNYKYLFDNIVAMEFVFNELMNVEDIDGTDKNILQIIKNNSRIPYLQIGKKIGMTRNAVKDRIRKLRQKRIIAANRIILNPNLMGKESYKILFKLKSDYEQKQKSSEK